MESMVPVAEGCETANNLSQLKQPEPMFSIASGNGILSKDPVPGIFLPQAFPDRRTPTRKSQAIPPADEGQEPAKRRILAYPHRLFPTRFPSEAEEMVNQMVKKVVL